MISDVLHDAIVDIRAYLETIPNAYTNSRTAVVCLVAHMEAVQLLLDTPDGCPPLGSHRLDGKELS